MTDMNHVSIIGRITRDAEMRQAGAAHLTTLSIGVNRSVKKGEKWETESSFFDVQVWNPSEKMMALFKKGKQVAVDGYLKQDRWEKDGQKFSKVSIVSNSVQLIGGAGNSTGNNGEPGTSSEEFPEDLPF